MNVFPHVMNLTKCKTSATETFVNAKYNIITQRSVLTTN